MVWGRLDFFQLNRIVWEIALRFKGDRWDLALGWNR